MTLYAVRSNQQHLYKSGQYAIYHSLRKAIEMAVHISRITQGHMYVDVYEKDHVKVCIR